MKRTLLLASVLLLTAASAQAGNRHYVYAPVVDVKPEYRSVQVAHDQPVCYQREHYRPVYRDGRSRTGTVLGAIIGGVIGNQIGDGNGRRAATVAGAALGGSIGRDIDRQNRHPDDYVKVAREECRIERGYQEQSVLSGYRVTYEYQGRLYHTRTDTHPGDRIRLSVSVSPAR